jgi:hypothetical protein
MVAASVSAVFCSSYLSSICCSDAGDCDFPDTEQTHLTDTRIVGLFIDLALRTGASLEDIEVWHQAKIRGS